MRTELKRLHECLKATFIYVTHDQALSRVAHSFRTQRTQAQDAE